MDPWHRVFCFGHFRWDKPFKRASTKPFRIWPINWHVVVVFRQVRIRTSKMHLSPRVLSVLTLLFCCCWLFCLLLLPLLGSVIVLCFVERYLMSILVLQSSWWGRESWLLCLICLPGVRWWLSGFSSRCNGVVCGLWLWYFLIILTYYF